MVEQVVGDLARRCRRRRARSRPASRPSASSEPVRAVVMGRGYRCRPMRHGRIGDAPRTLCRRGAPAGGSNRSPTHRHAEPRDHLHDSTWIIPACFGIGALAPRRRRSRWSILHDSAASSATAARLDSDADRPDHHRGAPCSRSWPSSSRRPWWLSSWPAGSSRPGAPARSSATAAPRWCRARWPGDLRRARLIAPSPSSGRISTLRAAVDRPRSSGAILVPAHPPARLAGGRAPRARGTAIRARPSRWAPPGDPGLAGHGRPGPMRWPGPSPPSRSTAASCRPTPTIRPAPAPVALPSSTANRC